MPVSILYWLSHIPASQLSVSPLNLFIMMAWNAFSPSECEASGCVSPLSCRNWPLSSAAPPASWLGRRSWCCSLGCLLSSCPQRQRVTGHFTVCLSGRTAHHNQHAAMSYDWYGSSCSYEEKKIAFKIKYGSVKSAKMSEPGNIKPSCLIFAHV